MLVKSRKLGISLAQGRCFSQLMSISPLDGRYAKQVNELRPYFSEFALMRFRVFVEIEWYKRLFSEKIVSNDPETIKFIES